MEVWLREAKGKSVSVRAVSVKIRGPPWTAVEKLPSPLSEILVFGPPQIPEFLSFLAPQSSEFPESPARKAVIDD